jgi:hypothetical protein
VDGSEVDGVAASQRATDLIGEGDRHQPLLEAAASV